jgi:hypothetical protein
VRLDDRGEFRLYGLQPGDYYLSISGSGPVGALGTTYYQGTLDETQAVAIHVEAGEEKQLGIIIRQPAPAKGRQGSAGAIPFRRGQTSAADTRGTVSAGSVHSCSRQ